jgi:hypothetical protein
MRVQIDFHTSPVSAHRSYTTRGRLFPVRQLRRIDSDGTASDHPIMFSFLGLSVPFGFSGAPAPARRIEVNVFS